MFRVFNGPGIVVSFLLLALAPAGGFAVQQTTNAPAATVHIETVGPKVGDALPEFTLRDQDSQLRSLKSLLGPDGAVIVFFRSADW